jgi:hypothetical protein
MPLHDVSQRSSSPSSVVPECSNCRQPDRVQELKLHDLAPGIHYWRCEGCGFVWATQYGEDLRRASA